MSITRTSFSPWGTRLALVRISSGRAANSSGDRNETCTGRSASTSTRSARSTASANSALIEDSSKSIRAFCSSKLPPVTSAP